MLLDSGFKFDLDLENARKFVTDFLNLFLTNIFNQVSVHRS